MQQAIGRRLLSAERLASFLNLRKEAKFDVLNSKQIEKEKIETMSKGFGGMKNARKYIKEKGKR